MGIEPTWDLVKPHAGFEDQERHQNALHLQPSKDRSRHPLLTGWLVRPPVEKGKDDSDARCGIRRARRGLVEIQLVSHTSDRRARMDSKVFSKVLHMAMFHGWTPERLSVQPPSASWDTQVIVPYIEPYFCGLVSHTDAAALSAGLKRMLQSEALGLPPTVHFAAISILAVADRGAFEVVLASSAVPSNASPAMA